MRLRIVISVVLGVIGLMAGLNACGQQNHQRERDWLTQPYKLIQTLRYCQQSVSDSADRRCQQAHKAAVQLKQQIESAIHGQTYFGVPIMKAQYQLVQINQKLDKLEASEGSDSTQISQWRIKKSHLRQLIDRKHAVVKYIFLAGKS